jgi:hypothetical protein
MTHSKYKKVQKGENHPFLKPLSHKIFLEINVQNFEENKVAKYEKKHFHTLKLIKQLNLHLFCPREYDRLVLQCC